MAASSTALGSVVLRCAPWFQQPDPPLRARDLLHVFGFSGFGPGLQPPIARWFERETKQLGLSSASHLMPLSLSRLVLQARLLDAPLSQWLARCRQLALDDTRSDELRRSALALEARLRALQACNRGETFEQAFQDTDQAWDDFDALVYELLGEEASALGGRGPAPQTLGAMRSLFSGLRVRLHDDPAARTILASLHQRRDRASSLANAREALGVSIESGQVAQGVDILEYEHYDGRPSGTLILLDVHHQGIAARPTPDPLLTEDQQSGLGAGHLPQALSLIHISEPTRPY